MTLHRSTRRFKREHATLQRMLEIYCTAHCARSAPASLCARCSELLAYADARLASCPWGETKPQCTRCTIHCYSRPRREEARVVMSYAGPRMLARHPVLAVLHVLDRFRRPERAPHGRKPPP